MDVQIIELVTNPFIKQISIQLDKIWKYLENYPYEKNIIDLPNNLKLYRLKIFMISDVSYLETLINDIIYESIDFSIFLDFKPDIMLLNGLKEILSSIIAVIYKIKVDTVSILITLWPKTQQYNTKQHDYTINFTPLYKNKNIYLPKIQVSTINSIVNLVEYYGYRLLSTSPLIYNALKLYENTNFKLNENIKFLNDERDLYPNIKFISVIKYTLELDDVRSSIQNLIEDLNGSSILYLDQTTILNNSIIVDPEDEMYFNLYREISISWRGVSFTDSNYDNNRIILYSEIDFGKSTKQWYQSAIEYILKNELPRYTLLGDWIYSLPLFKESFYLKERLLYYANTCYLKLLEKEYSLRFMLSSVKLVNYGIEAAFSSYDQVLEYEKILKENADTNYLCILRYTIFPVESFEDAIIVRWFLTRKYPDYFSLIIENENLYYVIIDGFRGDPVPKPNIEDLRNAQNELEFTLKKYYSMCDVLVEQSIPGFTVENMKNFTLKHLLKIIPIHKTNKRQICIYPPTIEYDYESNNIKDEFNNIEDEFNLITSGLYLKPSSIFKNVQKKRNINLGVLDTETYLKQKYLKYGLSGYFTLGPLSGYLDKLYILEEPSLIEKYDLGLIEINSYNLNSSAYLIVNVILNRSHSFESLYFNLLEDIKNDTEKNKMLEDKISRPLVDVRIDPILVEDKIYKDNLLEDIGLLWDKEWFLSPWAKYILYKTGKLSSVPFRTTKDLLYASESVIDGNRVLKALKLAADNYE